MVFPYNLLLMGWNDIIDYEADSVNPRKLKNLLSLEKLNELPLWIFVWNAPFAIYICHTFHIAGMIWVLGAFFACLFYNGVSFGEENQRIFHLSKVPIVDIFMNTWMWILPYFLGAFVSTNANKGEELVIGIFAAMCIGRCQCAAAIWDYEADKVAGEDKKKTIAILVGPQNTIHLMSLMLLIEAKVLCTLGNQLDFMHLVFAAPSYLFSVLELSSFVLGWFGLKISKCKTVTICQYYCESYIDWYYIYWTAFDVLFILLWRCAPVLKQSVEVALLAMSQTSNGTFSAMHCDLGKKFFWKLFRLVFQLKFIVGNLNPYPV